MDEYNIASYHRQIAAVFQDFLITAYSLRENIAMHDGAVDQARLDAALEQVRLRQHIANLPRGLETAAQRTIDDEGTELSGGESQRLALARALYKPAALYVLDEPTASLDAIEEDWLYRRFAALTEGKITILATHRLASVRSCQRILYFEAGQIAAQGTHDDLLERHPAYRALYESQARFYREEAADES